jgi:hypothetical protein
MHPKKLSQAPGWPPPAGGAPSCVRCLKLWRLQQRPAHPPEACGLLGRGCIACAAAAAAACALRLGLEMQATRWVRRRPAKGTGVGVRTCLGAGARLLERRHHEHPTGAGAPSNRAEGFAMGPWDQRKGCGAAGPWRLGGAGCGAPTGRLVSRGGAGLAGLAAAGAQGVSRAWAQRESAEERSEARAAAPGAPRPLPSSNPPAPLGNGAILHAPRVAMSPPP